MKLVLRIAWVSAVAGALLIAASGSASAATTIGANFPSPSGACGTNETGFQTASPGNQYAAPSAGVITSWTFQAGSLVPTSLKLKFGRPAGGANFLIVGESPAEHPIANTSNTYSDVHTPVQPGDLMGYWADGPTSYCGRFAPGYLFRFRMGDPLPGTTVPFGTETCCFQFDFSAQLEPDCDNDGLGDETQDTSVSGPNCPPTGQRAAALQKCKKKHKKALKQKAANHALTQEVRKQLNKKFKKCKKKARLLPV